MIGCPKRQNYEGQYLGGLIVTEYFLVVTKIEPAIAERNDKLKITERNHYLVKKINSSKLAMNEVVCFNNSKINVSSIFPSVYDHK